MFCLASPSTSRFWPRLQELELISSLISSGCCSCLEHPSGVRSTSSLATFRQQFKTVLFQWLLLVPGTPIWRQIYVILGHISSAIQDSALPVAGARAWNTHLVSDLRHPWPHFISNSRQCSLTCPTDNQSVTAMLHCLTSRSHAAITL